MNNDWIERAFEEAKKNCADAASIADSVGKFLDKNTTAILDSWAEQVGRYRAFRVASILNANAPLSDDIADMMKAFCIAGYLLARHDYKNGIMK